METFYAHDFLFNVELMGSCYQYVLSFTQLLATPVKQRANVPKKTPVLGSPTGDQILYSAYKKCEGKM